MMQIWVFNRPLQATYRIPLSGARHIADFDEPKLDLLEEALRSPFFRPGLLFKQGIPLTYQTARDGTTLPS